MTPSAASASQSCRSVPPVGKVRVALAAAVSVVVMVTGGCSSSHPSTSTRASVQSAGAQRVTIAATCALSARPLPDTAALTSLGVCSMTGIPYLAAQTIAAAAYQYVAGSTTSGIS